MRNVYTISKSYKSGENQKKGSRLLKKKKQIIISASVDRL